jgi:hypothetical protein
MSNVRLEPNIAPQIGAVVAPPALQITTAAQSGALGSSSTTVAVSGSSGSAWAFMTENRRPAVEITAKEVPEGIPTDNCKSDVFWDRYYFGVGDNPIPYSCFKGWKRVHGQSAATRMSHGKEMLEEYERLLKLKGELKITESIVGTIQTAPNPEETSKKLHRQAYFFFIEKYEKHVVEKDANAASQKNKSTSKSEQAGFNSIDTLHHKLLKLRNAIRKEPR